MLVASEGWGVGLMGVDVAVGSAVVVVASESAVDELVGLGRGSKETV